MTTIPIGVRELEFLRMQQQPAVEHSAIVPPVATHSPRVDDGALRVELERLRGKLRASNHRIGALGWTEPGDMRLARLQLESTGLQCRVAEIESRLSGRPT